MVELIWDGKYDKDGKRVAPLRVKLPFQAVETVSESAQQRQLSLDFAGARNQSEWRNRLIWGDKKYVLPSLLDEFAGKMDLIYIDPPFNVGANFSFNASIPDLPETEEDESATFYKEQSVIEQKAYHDTWGKGLDSYIKWFSDTAYLLFELLSAGGSIYVHLDWHVGHYAKLALDNVFSYDNFRNEIIWQRTGAHNDPKRFGNIHDVIFVYTKGNSWTFNDIYISHTEDHLETRFNQTDEYGKRFFAGPITAPGDGPSRKFRGKLLAPPKGRHWSYTQEKINGFEKEGRIYYSKTGIPYLKQYMDEYTQQGRRAQSIWQDLLPSKTGSELVGFPTQKPEKLLERIISASSKEGDLVLDCFAGSGTTAVVAEKMNRRWIACDLGRFAIHTTRKRLLSNPEVKPFVIQNLGKYERQSWQVAEFGSEKQAEIIQRQYRNFILELYSARPIDGYAWLHGIKDGRMVHVGAVDSPVAYNDLTQILIEFKKATGTGKDAPKVAAVDVLGWDFAFEINEIGIQQAEAAGINVRCLKIPREVMDPKAVEQGDVKFFELAALSVDVKTKKQELTLKLTDFTIPPDDVPEDVQKAIKHWSQWIDYWAVDWENKGDTFHNQWQTYRTRQDTSLKLETSHVYEDPGEYVVMVKVIDILGNDTTKTIKVKVG